MISLKFLYPILTACVISVVLVSCGNDEPQPKRPPVPTGRTVLVYMLASNNGLGYSDPYDYDMQDIREMCRAAKNGDITDGRLIVFHSASNGRQVLKEITSSGSVDTLKIYNDALIPQSAERMSEVLDDMYALAPAGDYGLILWGHGTGWLEDGISDEVSSASVRPYAYGSENGDRRKMNITSLASQLEGRGFSFVYFDCCYMASVEVVYQMRDVAPRIVAYPTEVLAFGMPYDQNVRHFFAREPELEEAARNTFAFYDAMSNPRYRMCTVSVINTAGLDRLAAAVRAIYENNTTGVPAGYTPQPYTTSRPYYYCDLGGYISALDADDEKRREFEAALGDVVALELATDRIWNTLAIREHSGLSTFIMNSDDDMNSKNYCRLSWFDDVASALIH